VIITLLNSNEATKKQYLEIREKEQEMSFATHWPSNDRIQQCRVSLGHFVIFMEPEAT
jgi:hypothetical protein